MMRQALVVRETMDGTQGSLDHAIGQVQPDCAWLAFVAGDATQAKVAHHSQGWNAPTGLARFLLRQICSRESWPQHESLRDKN